MGIGIHGPDGENPRPPNSAAAAASAAAATSSLERALDEATERYSVSPEVQRELCCLKAGLAGTAALDVSGQRAGALSRVPRRLRWRGREVSEEFQRYAERVASGEELAPYRGQVLARPCVDSPWGVPEPPPPRPVRASVVFGALLAASAWLVGVLLIAPRPPTSHDELSPLPNEGPYATSDTPRRHAPLSLDDLEPPGASGAVLSLADRERVARALTSGINSDDGTRTMSAGRRGAASSSASASVHSPEGAPPAAAIGEPGAIPEAPAPPAPEMTDDFDWLLDSAEGADGAAAGVAESALAPPPVAAEATRPSTGGDKPAAIVTDPPARPGSVLLLETPTF